MYFLEDLWQGRVTPSERAIQEGSPYEAINRESTACMRQLREELSEHGKKIFDRYCLLEEQLTEISEQDAFLKGVRIGVQFILDSIGEYPSQLPRCLDR